MQPRRHDADDPQVPDAVLHGRGTRAHRHDDAGGAGDASRRRSRPEQNILISGGTSTGKTTLLNALAAFLPADDRVVLIEDTAELQLDRPNLVRFEARREQGRLPAVTIRDLLRATLRHRPDRIIVGEVRGGEAFDLLQALNTGHAGSLSTIHANSAEQALARFASCVVQSGVELPYQAVRYQIADAIDVVLHLGRDRGVRVVEELIQVERYDVQRDGYDHPCCSRPAVQPPTLYRSRSKTRRDPAMAHGHQHSEARAARPR